jgi:hypothetical protein
MEIALLIEKEEIKEFGLLHDILQQKECKVNYIDLSTLMSLGITESNRLINKEKVIKSAPSLMLNLFSENDISKITNSVKETDQSFAYSQWVAYLPALINTLCSNIMNPPSINLINGISYNGLINRTNLDCLGFNVPKEITISGIKILNNLKLNPNSLVRTAEGRLLLLKDQLQNIKFPITIFKNKVKPESYFFFSGLLYASNLAPILTNNPVYEYINKVFNRINLSFGICYVSIEDGKVFIWNVLPLIPKSILSEERILRDISDKIIACARK